VKILTLKLRTANTITGELQSLTGRYTCCYAAVILPEFFSLLAPVALKKYPFHSQLDNTTIVTIGTKSQWEHMASRSRNPESICLVLLRDLRYFALNCIALSDL